jgi:hypothetical protein
MKKIILFAWIKRGIRYETDYFFKRTDFPDCLKIVSSMSLSMHYIVRNISIFAPYPQTLLNLPLWL